jgi:hypothetical protein
LCALAASARADPVPECDPDDPKLCATPIRKGELAPFDGQVLTTELAIKLGQKAEFCDKRLVIELSRATQLAEIELAKEKAFRKIDQDMHAEQLRILRSKIDDSLDRPFWREPWFVAAATATITVAAVVGVGWLAVDLLGATSQK